MTDNFWPVESSQLIKIIRVDVTLHLSKHALRDLKSVNSQYHALLTLLISSLGSQLNFNFAYKKIPDWSTDRPEQLVFYQYCDDDSIMQCIVNFKTCLANNNAKIMYDYMLEINGRIAYSYAAAFNLILECIALQELQHRLNIRR